MIDRLIGLLHQYPGYALIALQVANTVWSAIVDSLPQPRPMGNPFYQFFFTLAHKLAGNWSRKTVPDPAISKVEDKI